MYNDKKKKVNYLRGKDVFQHTSMVRGLVFDDIWQGWLTAGLAAVIAGIILKIDVLK